MHLRSWLHYGDFRFLRPWERNPLPNYEYIPNDVGMINAFITDATAYCARRGIKLATLGQYAVRDKTLFNRLSTGGSCELRTIMRVQTYMAENPPAATVPTTSNTEDAA